jgi:hypothetical protein
MMRAWRRWVRLLDTREPPESLAAMRIIVGATTFLTLAHAWWSGAAAALWVSSDHGGATTTDPFLLDLVGGSTWPNVRALLVIGLVASAMLVVGRFTRAAAIVSLLTFRTLAFSNPWSGGSGDDVVSNALLIVALSSAGAAWSLDARKLARPTEVLVMAWPRYLAIGQLIVIYTCAGWCKMSASWMPHGSLDAVWYSIQNPIWQRHPMPVSSVVGRIAQAATLTTWLFETSAPILFVAFYFRATRDRAGRVRRWFNRWDVRARYLTVGLCLHLGIELTMEVGAFFGGMMALYAACMHPTEWQSLASRAARALRRPASARSA